MTVLRANGSSKQIEINCDRKKRMTLALTFLLFSLSLSRVYSATVHISVNDVNEYAPKFNQPSYVVDVDEGRPVDKILQVEANDADCSAKYGDICRYDILNKDQPFAIDNEGSFSQSSTNVSYLLFLHSWFHLDYY